MSSRYGSSSIFFALSASSRQSIASSRAKSLAISSRICSESGSSGRKAASAMSVSFRSTPSAPSSPPSTPPTPETLPSFSDTHSSSATVAACMPPMRCSHAPRSARMSRRLRSMSSLRRASSACSVRSRSASSPLCARSTSSSERNLSLNAVMARALNVPSATDRPPASTCGLLLPLATPPRSCEDVADAAPVAFPTPGGGAGRWWYSAHDAGGGG
mmetsp:Transcript_10731/g.46475  ORF Transcript_10731/g.46475 Transcript_10731/m.46475 type:complete len:216 (+) Transcript_10731:1915-2562(+)